jgi:hypothetical protein
LVIHVLRGTEIVTPRLSSVKGTETSDRARDQSFFEFAHLLHLGGDDGESTLSNGPDTCFLNIVR